MPLLFIVIPLVGVILMNLPVFGSAIRKTAFWAVTVILLLQIVMSLTTGGIIWSNIDSIISSSLVLNLSLNGYSALMLLIIGLVALISLILRKSTEKDNMFNFANLILLVVMGMNGVVMVSDLFTLYVFLEITAISTFILIAVNKGSSALEGSFKYLVMSAVATAFMLCAIALMFMSAGSLVFADLSSYFSSLNGSLPLPVIVSIVLFVTGLLIKAGVVPFHGWLPDAYSNSSSAVSVLLAGIVTKIAGVYSILVVFSDVFAKSPLLGNILMIFGAVSIIVGALAAIGQNDFKTMLAYSSISQIGYIILGIGVGTPLAIFGALFHFFNHSIFKSLLFVNSAAVEMKTGTRKFDKLGGLASVMPVTGGTSVVGFLSTAGIPPLSGFWSKLIIIIAAWQAGAYGYAVIALVFSLVTLGYFLLLQRKVFFGQVAEGMDQVSEANFGFKLTSLVLSAITILVGILFPIFYGILNLGSLF